MPVKLLADENVDFRIIRGLRNSGRHIISVLESRPGITDRQVLEWGREEKAYILTEDSDFGELIFSYREKSVGVVFIRYGKDDLEKITANISRILDTPEYMQSTHFIVLTPTKIRIRDFSLPD